MVFKVVVTEVTQPADMSTPPVETEIFRQSVHELNIRALIAAVNLRPRKAREPKVQIVKKEGAKS